MKAEVVELVLDGSSGHPGLERAFAEKMVKLFDLFKTKQKSYGPYNISVFGERGVVIRSNDKIQRLIRMVWQEVKNPLTDETIEDTWGDLAVYAIIALLWRKGEWPSCN